MKKTIRTHALFSKREDCIYVEREKGKTFAWKLYLVSLWVLCESDVRRTHVGMLLENDSFWKMSAYKNGTWAQRLINMEIPVLVRSLKSSNV